MTREEAIPILHDLFNYYNDKENDSYVGFDKEDNEAIRMAIKALEQEPCEDVVSRKEVVEFLWNHAKDFVDARYRMAYMSASSLVENPNNVPSVTPIHIEQEPVLDKIRAEIKALSNANPSYWHSGDMVDRDDVLDIIDKYKAESENKA